MAEAPGQPDYPGVSRSDHLAGLRELVSWRALELSLLSSSSQAQLMVHHGQSERSPEARHEADSCEPPEWFQWLTHGQLGLLDAAAVGSVPALALSHFQQKVCDNRKVTQLNNLIG